METTDLPTHTAESGVPGLYEGAAYCRQGKYRPTYDSKMRSLDRPFEQINSEALTKHVYDFVSPIDEVTRETVRNAKGLAEVLTVRTPRPLTHSLQVRWWIDGKLRSKTSTSRHSSSRSAPQGTRSCRSHSGMPSGPVRTRCSTPGRRDVTARSWWSCTGSTNLTKREEATLLISDTHGLMRAGRHLRAGSSRYPRAPAAPQGRRAFCGCSNEGAGPRPWIPLSCNCRATMASSSRRRLR